LIGWSRSRKNSTVPAQTDIENAQPEACDDEFPGFVFAGPVTALENHDLLVSRFVIPEEIWINVNDADRDGNWVAEEFVPEPGGSALFMTALTTLGLMARRRRT
jgi:hypothetical protein